MKLKYSDILGKILLVGISYYRNDNELIDRKQFWGKIISADKKGIAIQQSNGEIFNLPPDLKALEVAPTGEYKLHSTGETVTNPDFLSRWNLYEHE